MSAVRIYHVADAVLALINGATLSMPINAERTYGTEKKIAEISDSPYVAIIPSSVTKGDRTRGGYIKLGTVEIGIQKKMTGSGSIIDDQVDALVDLSSEIMDLFDDPSCLAGELEGVVCKMATHDPIAEHDHIISHRVFSSMITVEFMGIRS